MFTRKNKVNSTPTPPTINTAINQNITPKRIPLENGLKDNCDEDEFVLETPVQKKQKYRKNIVEDDLGNVKHKENHLEPNGTDSSISSSSSKNMIPKNRTENNNMNSRFIDDNKNLNSPISRNNFASLSSCTDNSYNSKKLPIISATSSPSSSTNSRWNSSNSLNNRNDRKVISNRYDNVSLGINPIDTTEKKNTNSVKKPEAMLRCAYIETESTQTVIFWCEELSKWAFQCQNKINKDIREQKEWVMVRVPFALESNDPSYSLFLHRNNEYIRGFHGKFGIRLFHYTNKVPFQTRENLYITACVIAEKVNEDCKASLTVNQNRLFLYNKPCVWSNIIGQYDSLEKLKRETHEDELNDSGINPDFWDKHHAIIGKYFYKHKLTVELAEIFNAPLDNIDPSIPRTTELVQSVELRRKSANLFGDNNMSGFEENCDPETEFQVMFQKINNNNKNMSMIEEDLANNLSTHNNSSLIINNNMDNNFLSDDNSLPNSSLLKDVTTENDDQVGLTEKSSLE